MRETNIVIVGGGPAGLAAALYLGRFRRRVTVIDAGASRAALIPKSRNCPGFPDGIGGTELLARLRQQAEAFGAALLNDTVEHLERSDDGFDVRCADRSMEASHVVLATGLVDRLPEVPGMHAAIAHGTVRLCPVCDGYEAIGRRVAVFGSGEEALGEARFLKTYTEDLTLLADHPNGFSDSDRREAESLGIAVCDTVSDVVPGTDDCRVGLADGTHLSFEVVYPVLGCKVRSDLAGRLGADRDELGYVKTGKHQESSVPGLYAVGDVVKTLNQIAVGFGQAAIAATAIHNALRDEG